MTRLINDIRNDIRHGVLAHRFKPAIVALELEQMELAKTVYEDFFKASDRKTMYGLPNGWLPEQTHIQIKVGSEIIRLNFNGSFATRHSTYDEMSSFVSRDIKDVHKRWMDKHTNGIVKVYGNAPGDRIGYAVHQWLRLIDATNEEIKQARIKTGAALGNFFTIAKLIEEWPEIAPFIPAKSAPPPQLPALPVASLNSMLGLPV